jgi:mitofilin
LTPPSPSQVQATPPPPPPSTGSTPPPPPPPPKPRRRIRRFLTSLVLLGVLGYGGGIYYSRVNDNFHDFFTEYVPFGEDAVLYFEEREFRKRFPSVSSRSRPRDTGDQVKIPSQSGVSWKVSEDNRHANATKPDAKSKEAIQTPTEKKPEEKVKAVEKAKKETGVPTPSPPPAGKSPESQPPAKPGHPVTVDQAAPKAKSSKSKSSDAVAFTAPEVDQPSKFPPEVTRIDPINIKDAKEPLVQDLVKILNDIITVVNADNSNARFSTTIGKAKSELSKVGGKIKALKEAAQKEADAQRSSDRDDFERSAKELLRRVEVQMADQEAHWQQEYQAERERIQQNYEQKLKAEIDRATEVNEQRLRNGLLEQAVEMRRKFTQEVKDRVEEERAGRLGKLTDLSKTVSDLEKLTTDWNSVVDSNLKTQHLHVAVEAVRANLEKSQVPRPFIRELAALKEIASSDPVVDAAIASINPVAYQRGIPSSSQLIDRFRRVAAEVRKASLLPEDAGVASHASSYVLSKLLFKKKGLATGDDVESILTRTETYLEEGDLDGAAREMNGLKGWAKTLSRDWLGEVRKVLEVQQALDVSSLLPFGL